MDWAHRLAPILWAVCTALAVPPALLQDSARGHRGFACVRELCGAYLLALLDPVHRYRRHLVALRIYYPAAVGGAAHGAARHHTHALFAGRRRGNRHRVWLWAYCAEHKCATGAVWHPDGYRHAVAHLFALYFADRGAQKRHQRA